MTDWGDYTPGPWQWSEDTIVNHRLEGPDGPILARVNWVFERDHRLGRCDARLISKAYLIPKLTAFVAEIQALGAFHRIDIEEGEHTCDQPCWLQTADALAAELRSP